LVRRALRFLVCFAAVAIVTFIAYRVARVNAPTVGFAYLVLILVIAGGWGFIEAALTSIAAALSYNRYFFEPIGAFTIYDPQNWVAVFSFLTAALIASRLSHQARQGALAALERQQDLERLYTFSRTLLLSSRDEPFATQLVRKLAETFGLSAVVLYDRRAGEFYRAGPADFEDLDDQLRDAALQGTSFLDTATAQAITAVRLGSEPIASLALQGANMPDSVLQGVSNLVAIGLERARAQDLAHQVEAARQSEQLRTTLIDAMAHEFKTPLTLIKGATSSLLSGPDSLSEAAREQLTIADEEAEHLRELLDNAIEMARLDTTHIDVRLEMSNVHAIIDEVVASMKSEIDDRPVAVEIGSPFPAVPLDRRLVKLALKQLLDNALKYSPASTAVVIRVRGNGRMVDIEVVDRGAGIPPEERPRVFDRFYRGRSVRQQIPGSGLGLTIASSIARAHQGNLTVTSQPGETTFRLTLPCNQMTGMNA
jgi:two-component system sensor histidine kinase KdpD